MKISRDVIIIGLGFCNDYIINSQQGGNLLFQEFLPVKIIRMDFLIIIQDNDSSAVTVLIISVCFYC